MRFLSLKRVFTVKSKLIKPSPCRAVKGSLVIHTQAYNIVICQNSSIGRALDFESGDPSSNDSLEFFFLISFFFLFLCAYFWLLLFIFFSSKTQYGETIDINNHKLVS